jgi:hypothetical protein
MNFSKALFVAASLIAATPALAADAPEIKANAMVVTADGARIGRIDRVVTDAQGAPVGAKIIFEGRFVTIPASSLTSGEKGLVTSLSKKDVRKL